MLHFQVYNLVQNKKVFTSNLCALKTLLLQLAYIKKTSMDQKKTNSYYYVAAKHRRVCKFSVDFCIPVLRQVETFDQCKKGLIAEKKCGSK